LSRRQILHDKVQFAALQTVDGRSSTWNKNIHSKNH